MSCQIKPSVKYRRPYNLRPVFLCLTVFFANPATTSFAADNALQKSLEINEATNKESASSQQRIDQLSEQAQVLYAEYKTSLRQIESLKLYNNNLEQLIDSQKQEINSYGTQLTHIDDTQRDVIPLMIRMVTTLEDFVKLDQPFLINERNNRVAELKALLTRSDVSSSEKYRRIMEAYQVEMEYGRTIEAYKDTLEMNGEKRTVNFFRLGRVALFYQTLDEQETGVWDKASNKWIQLSSDYRSPVSKGLRIARKQAAPDLLLLPINSPEQAQ